MHSYDSQIADVCYLLQPTDNVTWYHKFSCKIGIDVWKAPQYNVDDWLNPASPDFQPEIHKAVFHYSAWSTIGEYFEVCILTPEMDMAAWSYGHHSQIILDGTFGVFSTRLLLFICMAIDEKMKGVPIALFLFSTPTGNQATHAGYNTAILQKLLMQCKMHLSQPTKEFTLFVVIMDTDTKEHGALITVWPAVCLLLCKFHLHQCWTNNWKKVLWCGGPEFWKDHIYDQLHGLEEEYVHLATPTSVNSQLELQIDCKCWPQCSLCSYIKLRGSLWAAFEWCNHNHHESQNQTPYISLGKLDAGWHVERSEWGRIQASAIIGIPVEGIMPTTNHLESFNTILKCKHLPAWLHSGHCLHFDSLIHILIMRVLPSIFSQWKAQKEYSDWLMARFCQHTSGWDLTSIKDIQVGNQAKSCNMICWWQPDVRCDSEAGMILNLPNWFFVACGPDPHHSYHATCASSKANILDTNHLQYTIDIHHCSILSCTCPDFIHGNGLACKHLRVL